MSAGLTIAVSALAILCAALLVVDLVRGKIRRGVIGLLLLGLFVFVLRITTGFPVPSTGGVIFGANGTIPVWVAVVAMFVGVIFGMIAQYVWTRPVSFEWLDFLRPIVISPMVLLPLIGSLSDQPLEMLQLLSLSLLAFQNGYFWQQVLKDAKPKET